MKVVTSAEMKQLEAEAAKLSVSQSRLMDNAGKVVAEDTLRLLGGAHGKKTVILAGPGNNGGDGEAAAHNLAESGMKAVLFLCTSRPAGDDNLQMAILHGAKVIEAAKDENLAALVDELASADAVIDAVFGTGLSRPAEGLIQKILLRLSDAKNARPSLKILAVDVPSGLNPDTGEVDPVTPFADYTITFGLPKRGLFSPSGAERAGEVITADIGIPAHLTETLAGETITEDWARSVLFHRSPYAHKGTFGKAMVLAGSQHYIGAARWSCGAAARVGAGLVTLAIPKGLQPLFAPSLPEATYLPLAEATAGLVYPEAYRTVLRAIESYNSILIGPGLGPSKRTHEFALKTIFRLPETIRLILDADALNYLAGVNEWWKRIPFDAVLTPHPGEMARLCGLTAEQVQADRFGLALTKAREWNKTIVLKGAFTLIASPDGRLFINPSANAALATAGTGDVLAGAIAGLLAQGMSPFNAASLGVYLHSMAGEAVKNRIGDAGLVATDLLPELPLAIKQLQEKS